MFVMSLRSNAAAQRDGGHEPRWTLSARKTLEQPTTSNRSKTARRLRWSRVLDLGGIHGLLTADCQQVERKVGEIPTDGTVEDTADETQCYDTWPTTH